MGASASANPLTDGAWHAGMREWPVQTQQRKPGERGWVGARPTLDGSAVGMLAAQYSRVLRV